MDGNDTIRRLPFGRLDQAMVSNANRGQRALEFSLPVLEKALQFGELRRKIVFLPDIELKKAGMIRKMIVDLGRGQAVPATRPSAGGIPC